MSIIRIETDKKILKKEKSSFQKKGLLASLLGVIPAVVYLSVKDYVQLPEYENIYLASGGLISLKTTFCAYKNFKKAYNCKPTLLEITTDKKSFFYRTFPKLSSENNKYEIILYSGIVYPEKNHGTIGVSMLTQANSVIYENSKFENYKERKFWIPDVKNPEEKIEMLKPHLKPNYTIDNVVVP